jgi:hypothetical protein
MIADQNILRAFWTFVIVAVNNYEEIYQAVALDLMGE